MSRNHASTIRCRCTSATRCAAIADIEARGRLPLLVGGTGLYLRAVIDELDIPPQFESVRAALDADSDTEGLHRRLCEVDPVAASRMEPSNRRRIVRALEVTLGSGRPFSSFGPGLAAYAATHHPAARASAWLGRARCPHRSARYAQQMEMGLLDEVRALLDEPAGLSRTASQALGYKELIEHVRGQTSPRRRAGDGHQPHQAVRPPAGALVSA